MFPTTVHPESLRHPLDPLSADEIEAVGRLVLKHHDGPLRIATIELREPPKEAVLSPSGAVDREAVVTARDYVARQTFEGRVSLTAHQVLEWSLQPGQQTLLTEADCARVADAVRSNPEWLEALRRRGVTDPALASIGPWGITPDAEEDAIGPDDRFVDAITMLHREAEDNEYARPLEGVLVRVDMDDLRIVKVYDYGVVAVPERDGNYLSEQISKPGNLPEFPEGPRTTLKDLTSVQPDGVSFTREGHRITWSNWDFRVGWSAREGLVLYDVHYSDRGSRRPVLYRAAVSEMVVPYGDTAPMHRLRNAFDVGECGLGLTANSLELGCDCPGETQYLDAVINDEDGAAVLIKNAICMHEEDNGIAWKHTVEGTSQVRRGRRFVLSFFTTIGNYDYGFYWYFGVDGSIEFETKLTGIIATGAFGSKDEPKYGSVVAPGLYGPNHQHFFCVRVDPMIDGPANTVYEHNSVLAQDDPANLRGNAWYVTSEPLESELSARRRLNFDQQRFWTIANDHAMTSLGKSPAYGLIPGINAMPMLTTEAPMRRRARLLDHHLWVTRYDRDELYAAGQYPHRSFGADQGLPQFSARDRSLVDQDLVVWYVFGVHHIVRPEDWPVMPVARAGFELRPVGFFDGNPALDLPRPDQGKGSHCSST